MATHEDGIYLDLPEAEYHADPALGASGICDLLKSPLTYWRNSPHNPDREEDNTPATDLGNYFHAVVAGDVTPYIVKPEGMSFATKEGKAFKEQHEGKVFVPFETAKTVDAMIDALGRTHVMTPFADHHVNEVSFFWTEKGGYRCKIRIDRFMSDCAVDWKTFGNGTGKDLETLISHTVAYNRYHVRAYWYQRGIGKMLDMVKARKAGAFKGISPTSDVMELFTEAADKDEILPFWFVFVESCRVPNIIVRRFVSHDAGGQPNAYYRAARNEVERATDTYARFVAEFGTASPWLERVPFKAFTDEEFTAARWILEEQ